MGRHGEIWGDMGSLRCEYATLGAGDMGSYGEIWAAYVLNTPPSGREIWGDMGRYGQPTWWVRHPRGGRYGEIWAAYVVGTPPSGRGCGAVRCAQSTAASIRGAASAASAAEWSGVQLKTCPLVALSSASWTPRARIPLLRLLAHSAAHAADATTHSYASPPPKSSIIGLHASSGLLMRSAGVTRSVAYRKVPGTVQERSRKRSAGVTRSVASSPTTRTNSTQPCAPVKREV